MSRRTFWRLLILGYVAAFVVIGATALDLVRHPSPPPINHCPPSDAANRWCLR